MNKNYTQGIPYMGSKARLASRILDKICEENTNVRYFYDLCGGGGSVSFAACQRNQFEIVNYNEFNSGVCELLKDLLQNGVTEKYYTFVSRDDFHEWKLRDDWLGGFTKVLWSFGNIQNTYLYGKSIENYKKMYHDVLVNNIDRTDEMSQLCVEYILKKYGIYTNLDLRMPTHLEYSDRKRHIVKQLTEFRKKYGIRQIQQLQRLEHRDRVEQLRKIKYNDKLRVENKSLFDVNIMTPVNDTVVYIDPPYQGTGEYQCKMDYEKLHEFVKNSPYKIYVSEYFLPFREVARFEHSSAIAPKTRTKTTEKLFCNK